MRPEDVISSRGANLIKLARGKARICGVDLGSVVVERSGRRLIVSAKMAVWVKAAQAGLQEASISVRIAGRASGQEGAAFPIAEGERQAGCPVHHRAQLPPTDDVVSPGWDVGGIHAFLAKRQLPDPVADDLILTECFIASVDRLL